MKATESTIGAAVFGIAAAIAVSPTFFLGEDRSFWPLTVFPVVAAIASGAWAGSRIQICGSEFNAAIFGIIPPVVTTAAAVVSCSAVEVIRTLSVDSLLLFLLSSVPLAIFVSALTVWVTAPMGMVAGLATYHVIKRWPGATHKIFFR